VPCYINTDNGVTMNAEGVEAAILDHASNWKRVEEVVPVPDLPAGTVIHVPAKPRPPKKKV
jgi:hypothetical protein